MTRRTFFDCCENPPDGLAVAHLAVSGFRRLWGMVVFLPPINRRTLMPHFTSDCSSVNHSIGRKTPAGLKNPLTPNCTA